MDNGRRAIRRLVLGHILAFGAITLLLATGSYLAARAQLARRLDANMAARMDAAQAAAQAGGLPRLLALLDGMIDRGGHFSYVLIAPDGRRLRDTDGVGTPPLGWGFATIDDRDDVAADPARLLTARLGDGARLTIVADRDYIAQFDAALLRFLLLATAVLLASAVLGSLALEASVRRRLRAMNATAAAIMDGDLAQRVPVATPGDEFDQLAMTVNRMLDRMNELLGDVRRMTGYLAHDLREPIAHLAQTLRRARAGCQTPPDCNATLERAVDTCEDMLELFGTILQMGEVDAIRIRAAGTRVDLSALVSALAEAHGDVAAAEGRQLRVAIAPGICVFGIADLLQQVLVNLIDNALTHTPPGTRIRVSLERAGGQAELAVTDNGPSLAVDDRATLLDDRTSNSGSGQRRPALGLKLVRAIVTAHGGRLTLADAAPGLRALVTLPEA